MIFQSRIHLVNLDVMLNTYECKLLCFIITKMNFGPVLY